MPSERQTPHQLDLLRSVLAQMKARRLTIREVASMVGCSTSNLSRILNGKIGLNAMIEGRLISSLSIEDTKVESVIEIIRGLGEPELRLTLHFLQILQRLHGIETTK